MRSTLPFVHVSVTKKHRDNRGYSKAFSQDPIHFALNACGPLDVVFSPSLRPKTQFRCVRNAERSCGQHAASMYNEDLKSVKIAPCRAKFFLMADYSHLQYGVAYRLLLLNAINLHEFALRTCGRH